MSDRHRSTSSESRNKASTGRDTNSNDAHALRCRVFIGNLATDQASKGDIEEIFGKFGPLTSCSLHNNFGFVQFHNEKDADTAVADMHGKTLFGKRVDVNLAGLRRKPQSKDQYEGAPPKEAVVPPDMLKKTNFGGRTAPPRNRDRSPVRGNRESNYGGRPLSPMSRYEELYRRDDVPDGRYSNRLPYEQPYDRPRGDYQRDYGGDRRIDVHTYDRINESDSAQDYRDPRVGYGRPYEESRPRPGRPAIDCEIVSLSKDETRYAEEVESRLQSIGLVCNIGFPPPDLPILELMDRIARSGTLYAVVVASQNAQHRSCTLNILHGTRQEHRNMPLNDALSFVARNFDSFLRVLRNPIQPAPPQPAYVPREDTRVYPPQTTSVFPNSEKQLSTEEINAMIEKLKKEKEEREAAAAASGGGKPRVDHERRDMVPGGNYLYNNYPPLVQAQNPNGSTSEPYYSQQHYEQQQPMYR